MPSNVNVASQRGEQHALDDVASNICPALAVGFHRRRLALHGPWAWLLRELAELQGVGHNHSSLRYIRHVLAVATPTAAGAFCLLIKYQYTR